jgi:hypothetical protein
MGRWALVLRSDCRALQLLMSCTSQTNLVTSVADPDPHWIRIQSGQWIRTRRAKMTHKSRKKLRNFILL